MNRLRWLALSIASCVIVTIWAQTTSFNGFINLWRPPRGDNDSTWQELRAADRLYREYMRADSLLPLMSDTSTITVVVSPLVERTYADSIHAAATREIVEIADPRARLGVFMVDSRLGVREGALRYGFETRELHVGTDSTGTYCAMVATARPAADSLHSNAFAFGTDDDSQRRRALYGSSVLGPCAFVAEYGAPGAGIARWLDNGGYRFAYVRGNAAREVVARHEPHGTLYYGFLSQEERIMRACRAGRTNQCTAAMLLETTSAERNRAATFRMDRNYMLETGRMTTLLNDVEQQFGADRFARFWSSEADMPTAFRTAFETDVGVWVGTWSRARWGDTMLGARIAPVDLILSALLIAMLCGVAMVVATRRQI